MTPRAVRRIVEKAVSDVRRRGDRAVFDYARRFDNVRLNARSVRVPAASIAAARRRLPAERRKALDACARRIRDFHWEEKKRIAQSWTVVKNGVRLGQIYSPVSAVGVYVPGGRFSYPSTLLMAAIPARMAGVERVAVVTPAGKLTDEILAAADIAGVKEIYRVGGPAALAALAIGTASIPKVDLIVGPGNALVTEAKRQLFGEVGIDLLAGPSELVVLADDSAPAAFVAADLAAQAEHDPDSTGILVSLSKDLVRRVRALLPKAQAAQCRFHVERDLKKAVALANSFAGEHVEVMLRRPQDAMANLKNGGTFFVNPWSPAVMGDYWAGPSHVLPTGRSARFASGLSVMTFLKRSSLVEVSMGAFRRGWTAAHAMAVAEGLTQHARSLRVRVEPEESETER